MVSGSWLVEVCFWAFSGWLGGVGESKGGRVL